MILQLKRIRVLKRDRQVDWQRKEKMYIDYEVHIKYSIINCEPQYLIF